MADHAEELDRLGRRTSGAGLVILAIGIVLAVTGWTPVGRLLIELGLVIIAAAFGVALAIAVKP